MANNEIETDKNLLLRDKYDYNKALSLKSPSLNKRYRYSVLPTVSFF